MAAVCHRVAKDDRKFDNIGEMMIVMMAMMIMIVVETKHKAQIIDVAEYQNTNTKKTKP